MNIEDELGGACSDINRCPEGAEADFRPTLDNAR